MSATDQSAWNESAYGHLIGFFEQGVLATYRNEPNKYIVETDNFEGHVTVTAAYYRECESACNGDYIDVKFGYRLLRNGDLAVAAYLPDLVDKSESHVRRWSGFHLDRAQWADGTDERWEKWVRRYLEGDWDVDNGPRSYLPETLRTINALTMEVVGCDLFTTADAPAPNFPSAQNDHTYQDAHRALYGYVIDGLDKACLTAIAAHKGVGVNLANDNTVKSLKRIGVLPPASGFWAILETISEQRRKAAHSTRPPAQRFAAFEEFNRDLEACVTGLRELLSCLEGVLGMNGETARERQEAKGALPHIVRPAESTYSICQIKQVKGKTVERVEYGFRHDIEGVHQSEAMILYFTDGSILSIDTGLDVSNITDDEENDLRPEDFNVDFVLQWVPPPSRSARADTSAEDS